MPITEKRKFQCSKALKSNGILKAKKNKIHSSSSESKLDGECSKSITVKKQAFQIKTSPRKKSSSKCRDLSLEELSNSKNNGLSEDEDELGRNRINLEKNDSTDSDEHPLVIDEQSDNDLEGLQKYMNKNFLSNKLDSINTKSVCNISNSEVNSSDEYSYKVDQKRNDNEVIKYKKDANKKSSIMTSESESDQEEIQKTMKKTIIVPIINNNLKKPEEVTEENNSNISDFHLILENVSPSKEKEIANNKTDLPNSKSSSDTIEHEETSKKVKINHLRKVPSPIVNESDELESENEQEDISDDSELDNDNDKLIITKYSKYRPTEEERMKLVNMFVTSRYITLPQHKVERTAGTRTMNQHERKEFEKYATLKQGTFTSAENKIIKRNWRTFCLDNGWNSKNPKPFLFMKHENKQFYMSLRNRKKFMQCLAHNLPNRSLYSTFQKFKTLFYPHKTSRYTKNEDLIIVDFINNYKLVDKKDRKFADLSVILKRTRASVWRRFRVLSKKFNDENKPDDFCSSSR